MTRSKTHKCSKFATKIHLKVFINTYLQYIFLLIHCGSPDLVWLHDYSMVPRGHMSKHYDPKVDASKGRGWSEADTVIKTVISPWQQKQRNKQQLCG